MNDTPIGPMLMMGLLFVLRCLIPLGILFGISYWLRRLELVVKTSDEALADMGEDLEEESLAAKAGETASATKSHPGKKAKTGGKKKKSPISSKERNQ